MWPFHLHTFYYRELQVPMEMEMVLLVVYTTLFLSALLMSCLPLIGHQKTKFHGRAKLPPGSMGWPYLGETLQFYSQNPNLFFAQKQKRYGEIFKTHLLGCPCVMLASPEAAKFVLVNQSHLFKPTYPKSKEYMIGPSALFFHQGDYHSRLRKLVQGSFSPDSIRRIVPGIEAVAVAALGSWDSGGAVMNSFQEMKKFSFDVGILTIFGQLNAIHREELKKNYWIMDKGYNSFPTNIPGTLYNNAVLARRRLSKIVSEIICGTRERKRAHKDLLGCLMDHQEEKGETISDEQIADNIIGVLFASMDTTASILTWILKYLHDDPKLLESVMEEQRPIYEANNGGKQPMAWSQTRSMPLTHKVILESLRMSSIISFTFREAVADVEYNGYLIPKGWKVMPLFRNIHHNPELFPDPHKFDPTRFEVSPKPNTFLPFGSGVHSCPGNELAKLEILIMLHHLVTKFRWEVVGSESGIQYGPFPVPKHGLPARFWKLAVPPAQRFGRHA